MNVLDFAVLALLSMAVLMVFVSTTDIEKSRVRVRVKSKK